MNIESKKSQKAVKYENGLAFMEKRLYEINRNDSNDEQIDSPVIGSPKTVQEDNQPDDLPF